MGGLFCRDIKKTLCLYEETKRYALRYHSYCRIIRPLYRHLHNTLLRLMPDRITVVNRLRLLPKGSGSSSWVIFLLVFASCIAPCSRFSVMPGDRSTFPNLHCLNVCLIGRIIRLKFEVSIAFL